jgi:hypothetical protein
MKKPIWEDFLNNDYGITCATINLDNVHITIYRESQYERHYDEMWYLNSYYFNIKGMQLDIISVNEAKIKAISIIKNELKQRIQRQKEILKLIEEI